MKPEPVPPSVWMVTTDSAAFATTSVTASSTVTEEVLLICAALLGDAFAELEAAPLRTSALPAPASVPPEMAMARMAAVIGRVRRPPISCGFMTTGWVALLGRS